VTPVLLHLSGIVKEYGALRPLRVAELTVAEGDHVVMTGIDRAAAEVLVNMVTGASLPDRGEVRVFGRATTAIADSDDWLAMVDRFGILSERAVLLESLSVIQNLAVPFSLEIEPPSDEVRQWAEGLAEEVGLSRSVWDTPVADLDGELHVRVRLARALALDPRVLLAEHPTAAVADDRVTALGHDIRRIADRRGMASVTVTASDRLAAALATRVLALDPATGRLTPPRRSWFVRRPRTGA
jgi:ABC-type transporter Mla maintaining outer membrane lipid asymmetry ATPase subunit MlaF